MNLSADEIVKILETCRGLPVSELRYGPLKVAFYGGETAKSETQGAPQVEVIESQRNIDTLNKEALVRGLRVAERVQDTFADENEFRSKEDELSLLMIEDPVEYERLLAEGDLVHGKEAIGTE
jgi:hypothetical protein